MKIKGILIVAICLSWFTFSARAGEWLTDFAKAKDEAAQSKRLILADFSGSDWCGWCVRLDKEVFSKAEFNDFAKDNLILFLADFPRGKDLDPAIKKQNDELALKYGIRGFPTVLLLDAEGKVIAQTGYKAGGAAAYVKHLKELMPAPKDSEPAGDTAEDSKN